MLEKLKLNSILDLITMERMYGNQMLYLQVVIFEAKPKLQHTCEVLIERISHIDINKEKNRERLKQRENFWMLTLETLTPKGLNQKLN